MEGYGLLGIGLLSAATAVALGGPALGLLWPALGCLFGAAAYLAERPTLLGKRRDGTLALGPVLVGLPLYVIAWTFWGLQRALGGERPLDEVAPGIFVGRRPHRAELPAHTAHIVDLTAELWARPDVRAHPGYQAHPVLDGTVPRPERLEAIVRPLVHADGAVLFHCAAGHGRSAAVAAALGLLRGHFRDPDHAVAEMRRARPGIRLHHTQRRGLWEWYRRCGCAEHDGTT